MVTTKFKDGSTRSWGFAVNIHGIVVSAPPSSKLLLKSINNQDTKNWIKENSIEVKEVKAPINEQGVREIIYGKKS